jgi:osmotically-inducible protein OsmY
MLETQMAHAGLDEPIPCRDRSWLSIEDETRFGVDNLDNIGEFHPWLAGIKPGALNTQLSGLIHIGQRVFSPDGQLVGLTTKLFLNLKGQVSYLAVRTARLFGQHKMVPVTAVSDVTSIRVLLSINPEQFKELPEYHDDQSIGEEVDRALWKDEILRNTEYHQIDVQVRDGIVVLNGYVSSSSQWRIETALKNIPGILGVKSYLIADDKLLLQVVAALVKIEQIEGNHVFAKVQNGGVVLSGKVISIEIRDFAEQRAANVPWVRAVINNIEIPGVNLEPEDQRFLQPVIGKNIYFKDGLSGVVRQVIINQNNLRVANVVIQGQFPEAQNRLGSGTNGQQLTPDRLAVIPVNVIRYLTNASGFLLIDSTETTRYQDYYPDRVVSPDADWVPPYPYCIDHVRFWKNIEPEKEENATTANQTTL